MAIKASINLGLSSLLKQGFSDIIPVERPKVECFAQKIKDPWWLVGFTEGEGCFIIHIQKSSSHISGSQVRLRYQISQHVRDSELLRSFVEYFGGSCGNYYESLPKSIIREFCSPKFFFWYSR